ENQRKSRREQEQQPAERDAVHRQGQVERHEKCRAIAASLPCRGGMGRGVSSCTSAPTPLPVRALCARTGLPHKGGGNKGKLAVMRNARLPIHSRFFAGG